MDLISVVVPIYNLDAYLYQCVSSIVGQTYKNLEIILVDDGSTDNALEICEFFRKSDGRIRLIAKPNGGLVSARKAGLNAATGKYVFYVDGDDWITSDCIAQYHKLASAYNTDIVVGDYKREFLGNFVTMRNSISPGFYDRRRIENEILPRMISHGAFFNHGLKTYSWGKLYKRSAILALQNQVPDGIMIAEDAALIYPAIYQSNAIYIADIVLCNYRQRPNSILKSTSFDNREIGRIAAAFQYLVDILDSRHSQYGFEHQLQAYFAAIVTIRSGGFLSSMELYEKFNIFGAIPPGARLALYNSGSFGQHAYKHLQHNGIFTLAGWFDRDYKENNILHMQVNNPEELHRYSFDFLIVPSFDPALHAEVDELFEAQGLARSKIRTATLDSSNLAQFINSAGYDPITFRPITDRYINMSGGSAKRIVILGGNPETGALVEAANAMGHYTIVLDPVPNSPSKRHAAKSYDIDVTDLDAVDEVIRQEHADGVLVGVADPLVPYYQKICARNSFYCYANDRIIHALTSKSNFAQTCIGYGISVTPSYQIDYRSEAEVDSLAYPVVVKPVDAGAGVGISVCRNPAEFQAGVSKALAVSIRKELLVEKFMKCNDMFAYYTFVDGVAYLSALADRHKTDKQGQFSSVCIAAEYPSRHTDRFVDEVHPKLVKMLHELGISNGVLLIQFFVDADDFYAYDPGFRLQGEAPHLYLKHFNQFDQREMLLQFALTGQMFGPDFQSVNDFRFKNQYATTVWVLLKVGKVGAIGGMEALRSNPNIIQVLQRFQTGEAVTSEMVGTERQVFARIYTVARTPAESAELLRFINRTLSVNDELGRNLVLDWYQKESA
jgi:glycosyltransferase involved in cell wall biosynthesis/formate-dependent phosphoribosylglycinamide formyltransferase (GAR transformylase)